MSGKRRTSKSKSFALYEESWLLLKELEYLSLKKHRKQVPLKEIAHKAIKEYAEKEKPELRTEK